MRVRSPALQALKAARQQASAQAGDTTSSSARSRVVLPRPGRSRGRLQAKPPPVLVSSKLAITSAAAWPTSCVSSALPCVPPQPESVSAATASNRIVVFIERSW